MKSIVVAHRALRHEVFDSQGLRVETRGVEGEYVRERLCVGRIVALVAAPRIQARVLSPRRTVATRVLVLLRPFLRLRLYQHSLMLDEIVKRAHLLLQLFKGLAPLGAVAVDRVEEGARRGTPHFGRKVAALALVEEYGD